MKNYNDILVSVVMPVYNGALYLREAIDSILSQTHTNLELIIINDGSTDNSEEIIRSYNDSRILYLINEKNSGICVTLNKGLDIAKGKYIARMDCDDISVPERLQMQIEYMEQNPSIGILGSDIVIFGEGIEERDFQMVHDPELCSAGLLFNPCFAHPTVIWRKEIMEELNLRYDENYRGLEDFVMWWKFAEVTRLANIPQVLLRYRRHKSQETQNRTKMVTQQSNEFRRYRYQKMGITLSSSEMKIFDNYSYGNFNEFNTKGFSLFVEVMAKIIKRSTYPISTSKKAIKVISAKAIGYILNQSLYLRENRMLLLTKAFVQGALPISWYLRFLKSYLF